jgi:hypothetical protein
MTFSTLPAKRSSWFPMVILGFCREALQALKKQLNKKMKNKVLFIS